MIVFSYNDNALVFNAAWFGERKATFSCCYFCSSLKETFQEHNVSTNLRNFQDFFKLQNFGCSKNDIAVVVCNVAWFEKERLHSLAARFVLL
jgi:hypothetical protein